MTVSQRYDPETGLLNADGMEHALDVELARAARHEVPLSLILMQVPSPADDGEARTSLLAHKVAEALLGSVRTEDPIGRLGELRFAVLATEGGDGAPLARRLADHVRKHLRTVGADGLPIAVAAVDCQYDEMTRAQLLRQAETEISSALLAAANGRRT